MAEAILDLVPDAHVWHLGLYRDHQTLQPVTYYNKLPPHADIDVSFLVDPMLVNVRSVGFRIHVEANIHLLRTIPPVRMSA